jgi:prophage maintenance system killer protein
MFLAGVPRTARELAELEASYRPFQGAESWSGLHVDAPRWNRFAHILARRRGAADDAAWTDATDRLLRAAALDSTALDGLFPPNPELTTVVLDGSISRPDDDEATDPIEVVAECHRRALVLASEAAADGRGIDSHLMAVLQDVITETQATYSVTTEHGETVEVDLPRRQYKPVSNYLPLPGGGLAAFAPAPMVAAEMERLTAELSSGVFATLHPVVQAAYAHYALTAIHPFADGNGRLARTVASIFLMRSAYVPLIVFAEQWPAYYQALKEASQADEHQALVDFVSVCAMSVMDLAANLVARPVPGGLAGELLAPGAVTWGGEGAPSAGAFDEAACGLLQTLAIELREALVSPLRGIRIAITTSQPGTIRHAEEAYRAPKAPAVVRFAARVAGDRASSGERTASDREQEAAADLEFAPLVSTVPGDQLPIALRETRTGELLEVALDDAYPVILEPATLRIRLWVQRLIAEALEPIMPVLPDDRSNAHSAGSRGGQ